MPIPRFRFRSNPLAVLIRHRAVGARSAPNRARPARQYAGNEELHETSECRHREPCRALPQTGDVLEHTLPLPETINETTRTELDYGLEGPRNLHPVGDPLNTQKTIYYPLASRLSYGSLQD